MAFYVNTIVLLFYFILFSFVSSDLSLHAKLHLLPTEFAAGFGHRFTTLLCGVDLAEALSIKLEIDPNFWKGTTKWNGHGSFEWAWKYLPRQEAQIITTAGRRDRAENIEAVKALWRENATIQIDLGNANSCGGGYCFTKFHGVYSRHCPLMRAKLNRSSLASSAPLHVIWHFRTGDIRLNVSEDFVKNVKDAIDTTSRSTRHTLLTENESQLRQMLPFLSNFSDLHSMQSNPEQAFELMRTANILVNTGSSFPHSAACLGDPSTLIYLYGPPKEALHPENLRHEGIWRTYFLRTSIPLHSNGSIFQAYKNKFRMSLSLLSNESKIPQHIYDVHFETAL
jgi:hypothetical protein